MSRARDRVRLERVVLMPRSRRGALLSQLLLGVHSSSGLLSSASSSSICVHVGVSRKREELPEALRRVDRRVVAGRIEDVVEPALRLGEALVLAQMHRDRQRNMEEQLPVVVGVRAAVADVDLLREARRT